MTTAPDDLGIYNFRRLSPTLTTSGQPTETQFAGLAAAGITRVINLALDSSPGALPDEAGTLAALGLRYGHVPVEFTQPTEADFERFCAALDEAGDATLHVHCAANYRVSAFFYRYRVEALGCKPEEARGDLDALWTPDAVWQAFLAHG